MSFINKVCVVTGASSGIGRRTALDLARAGARVTVAARREDRLTALVEEMGGPSKGHSFHVTDVSNRDQVKGLVAHVAELHGRCDVLINNAGIPGREKFGPEAIEAYEQVMQINFFGAVYCTAEFLDLLERSAPANVVNVASVAGRIATPGFSSYVASKFALIGWTESMQLDLVERGIYMSSVEPGFVPTEGFPQANMIDDPLMSKILGTDADVSAAIMDAIENRKPQRVVPRWYYALQVPKVLVPPAYRFILEKVMNTNVAKKASEFKDPL